MQYDLVVGWHFQEGWLDLLDKIDPSSHIKTKAYREASRGSGKTVAAAFLRLYICEYLAPFWKRPGLPIRPENRMIAVFGRDQNHIRDDIMVPLKHLITNHAPWLRTAKWDILIEDTENPNEEGLRTIADMKSRGAQKWEAYRIDLANGISIRTRTIRQSARGLHIFFCDFDDLMTEGNVHESSQIMDLIRGAVIPALEPGGLVLYQGTPQCIGDTGDLIIQEGDWDVKSYPAYDTDGKLGYAYKNQQWMGKGASILDPDHLRCLWPIRLSPPVLEQAEGTSIESRIKYQREYLLLRVTDETSLVTREDMIAARDDTISYHHAAQPGFHYGGGCDPSGRQRDDAAFCLGSVTKEGIRIPLHFHTLKAGRTIERGEGEFSVVEALNNLAIRFKCWTWWVEANGYQGIIKAMLRRMNPSIQTTLFDLMANKHTEQGWKAVRTVFLNRMVRLPYKTAEDRRITDAFCHQLAGLQIIEGKVSEDRKRKNDLVSAFFLFIKSTEIARGDVQVSVVSLPTGDRPTFATSPLHSPLANRSAASTELRRPPAATNSMKTAMDRLARAQSRYARR